MILSRIAIAWGGLGFFCFGLAYLIAPEFMVNLSGMEVPTPASITDTRAMYGGLQIGLGSLTLFCAFNPRLVNVGVLALALTYGGIVVCRLIGFLLDPGSLHGSDHYHLWALGILEVPVTATLITALVLAQKRDGKLF